MNPDPNSATIWLPAVISEALPVPATEIVPFDNATMWCEIGEGDRPGAPIDWNAMRSAAASVGFPCFVRTDLSSAKHAGPSDYRCDSIDDVRRVVLATFYDNCMKDLFPVAMLFRRWIDLDATFSAFGYGRTGHPIAREWRVFADRSGVKCRHFYWPQDAIDGNAPSESDWRERLERLEELTPREAEAIEKMAVTATTALDGEWSVDFAKDRSGRWWLIDMALARFSWHPEHP